MVVLPVQHLSNGEELLEKCLAGRRGSPLFGLRDRNPRRLSQPSQREESSQVALRLLPRPVAKLNFKKVSLTSLRGNGNGYIEGGYFYHQFESFYELQLIPVHMMEKLFAAEEGVDAPRLQPVHHVLDEDAPKSQTLCDIL